LKRERERLKGKVKIGEEEEGDLGKT